jgi:hypothetical protein
LLPPAIVAKCGMFTVDIWLRQREAATQIMWLVPDAVVTFTCAPDDGWSYHQKHVEKLAAIKTVYSRNSLDKYLTFFTLVNRQLCDVAPPTESRWRGKHRLLVAQSDNVIFVTCESELKLWSGIRRAQNGETEHPSGHITTPWMGGELSSVQKSYTEAYILKLVLGLVQTVEESFRGSLWSSQLHMWTLPGRNMKQSFWKQQGGVKNFAPSLRVLNFLPILLFSFDSVP